MDLTILMFGCTCWLPLAVWILCLVHWLIGGDIEWYYGIVGIFLAFFIGAIALHPPTPIVSPIACFVAFTTVFAFPIVTYAANRHELKAADIDQVDRAYKVLGNSPANSLAKFKLAESIYKMGLIGHAVALGDVALANLPERIAREEYRMLRRWKNVGVPPETLKPITCVECHTYCQPGWTHCRNCGAPFLLDRVRGRILPSGFAGKIVAVWAVAVILLVGLPAATILGPGGSIAAMTALVVLAGTVLFFTFRPVRGQVA